MSDTAATSGGPMPNRSGSPRDRLLAAAREVLDIEGLEGLSLRAIARRAGVSHGAPLRHFPTLAALLAALAAEGFARLVAAVDDAVYAAEAAAAGEGRALRAVERLAAAGRAYVEVAVAEPGVFSVTFRPERCDVADPEYQHQAGRSFGQLVGLVEAAQVEGWRPDEPPTLVAAALWATVHGIAELQLHGALQAAVAPAGLDDVLAVSHRLVLGDLAPEQHQGRTP